MNIENFGTKIVTVADTTALAAVPLYWELGFKPSEVEVISLYESTEARVKWNQSMWNFDGGATAKIVDSDATGNYFYLNNDLRQTFYKGFAFTVAASPSGNNDGAHVVSSVSYDRDTNRTRVGVTSVTDSNEGGTATPTKFGGGFQLTHGSADWTELTAATGLRMYAGGDKIVYNNPATPSYKIERTSGAILAGQVIGINDGIDILSEKMPAVSNDDGSFHRLESGILIPALAAIRGNAQVLTLIARR